MLRYTFDTFISLRAGFLSLAQFLHRATLIFCSTALILLFGGQVLIVILRYLFAIGFIQLQDLVSYSFAMVSVLALPLAVRLDRHVRVDVFRSVQPFTWQRRIDKIGFTALLVPLFGMIFWHAWPLVAYSWSILEGSRETGGLAGYFIVVSALPLACLLTLIQGLAFILSVKCEQENQHVD